MSRSAANIIDLPPGKRELTKVANLQAILDAARRVLITERTAGSQVAALDEQILRAAAAEDH